jgi:predicted transcriptional regulator of viral defense system
MEHTIPSGPHLPRGRAKLGTLLRAVRDIVLIDDVVRVLHTPRKDAAKLLSRWAKQGWLRRVGSGAYVAVPLDSLTSEYVLDDPWVLVPALFGPAYVGGRTAAQHWDLTEQLFRDIVVITAQPIRSTREERHAAQFTLKHVRADKIFGTKNVWRHHTKVAVSDVHRTIIDMLDEPALGGGIQQVADCLDVYLRRADRNDAKLMEYADRLGNGAVFKRLGFLAECATNGEALAASCKLRITKGTAKLDPAIDCSRLVTRWRLWIPTNWAKGRARD